MRRAVIDIGTNSVKLLVAETDGCSVHPLWEGSEQTRLGQGFYASHLLNREAIARTARSVAVFADKAQSWNPERIRVIATSAAREAQNQTELLDAVRTAAKLDVEVISGDLEADLVFVGVRTTPSLAGAALLITDVGGGSTEFILGRGEHQEFRQSFPLGTVRLLEKNPLSDPPLFTEWDECQVNLQSFFLQKVAPLLRPLLNKDHSVPIILVGTGGTPALLAAMELKADKFERTLFESVVLSQRRLDEVRARLWQMPMVERRKIPGLPANRADVILFGVAVLAEMLRCLNLEQLRVSTRGLRYGAIL